MKFHRYIACLCEGSTEETIMNLLLDADLLKFQRNDLLEEKPLRIREADSFERRYLRRGFQQKITVLRILDSRNERFWLSRAYQSKVEVINVVTAPEIEMLIIFSEDQYTEYKKSGLKPSVFCKQNLKMHKNVKTREFVEDYFSDTHKLVDAIKEYARVSNVQNGEITLADLLK